MTSSSKAATIALKGLAIAGNMIASIAIAQAISFTIKKRYEFANAAEIARENQTDLNKVTFIIQYCII